ncbi:phage replisome organizer N-terminal domain-containing protein [Enterococcus avium]|uniref:phage replisome organizer N-terminal domain-containing protein n=1 Tax=Enterococcus avium TaxID=33945 RepID=UPI00209D3A48|nr:phage replisome organizer N-terminal domain-containing protein [Enterococcus avium]
MADNKKYYYLKLKDNFFDSDEMIVLESMPDGYIYSNILLKLYLRSLKTDGRLMFNERIPFNSTMLSQVTRHSVGNVEKAIRVFSDLGVIEVMDNGAIYMTDIQNFIGKSSTEADRIREYRAKIDKEKSGVQMLQQMNDKSTPELEIELEKEIDIKKDKETRKKSKLPRHKFGEYKNVLLSDQDLAKIKAEFPSDWKQRIEDVSEYCATSGKNYNNYLAVIRRWAKNDRNQNKQPTYKGSNQNFQKNKPRSESYAVMQYHIFIREKKIEPTLTLEEYGKRKRLKPNELEELRTLVIEDGG